MILKKIKTYYSENAESIKRKRENYNNQNPEWMS